ncbi:hypothetical protein VBM89_01170 [Mycoplasma sp. 1199]|uniref:hypothetical protein n=1 Tax=Mycoplasma sp. 1199 TaxID=3108526 RepID=UPI002B1CFA47|nr:hypothetical protein [Mycoplasma sp. 1199]MEA4206119.1 hypothetical protein [Mycoplasma sp. 1199]
MSNAVVNAFCLSASASLNWTFSLTGAMSLIVPRAASTAVAFATMLFTLLIVFCF